MRGPARRRPALRTVAAVLSVLVAATALTVPASSAAAASGPSVTPPDTTSTPVDQQSMGAHAQDPASKNELHGNQTPPNGPTDGGGTSKASPLSPSATWSVSAQSGNFSWKYPLRLPPAPGNFVPQLGLAYSSSAIDGRTSATNNQPSWVGDGWDLSAGFLERSYIPCADDTMGGTTPPKVGDLCWRSENATASYGSHASELVRDDKNGTWHPRADDGSRVEQKFGAGNGDDNGEYWKITTVDGTQYLFGSDKDAHSTWTVPVFGDDDKEPCHQTTFDASHCVQAWRWNLDKVIDRNGNVIKYHYAEETNNYGMDKKDAATGYVRGGTMTSAEYGLRDDSSDKASARIDFTTGNRCVRDSDCTLKSDGTPANKDNWPDVPWDDQCNATPCKDKYSPSFWTTQRLTAITTKVWSATENKYNDVESWTLDGQFPDPGDGEKAALWLKGITHTGLAGGTPVALPPVTFDGKAYPNKVVTDDAFGPLNRYRVVAVNSEAGGIISVNYAPSDCTATNVGAIKPESNTLRCFPMTWAKQDFSERTDYFQKYVVASVAQSDRISANPEDVTEYQYLDGAAWAFDVSELAKDKNRNWNQFRGYGRVRIKHGTSDNPSGPITMTEQRFYRGMDGDKQPANSDERPTGDKLPTAARTVSVKDSDGGSRTDDLWLSGQTYETQTHDGTGETVVAKTITTPDVQGPSATRGTITAYRVNPGTTKDFTLLAGGGWRTTKKVQSYDEFGQVTQVDDQGDTGKTDDDRCTTTAYNRNTDAWLVSLIARTETVATKCGTAPAFPGDAISATRYAYDTTTKITDPPSSTAFTDPPSKGNVTRTEVLDQRPAGSTAPTYSLKSTAAYDKYGRATSAGDALGHVTGTTYSPTTGGPVTSVTTTNPLNQVSTSTLETAYGQPVLQTDVNNRKTEITYDALGRKTEVWLPNRPRSSNTTGNQRFSYSYPPLKNGPVAVRTSQLNPNGTGYNTIVALYDGLLRLRQEQRPAQRGGRLITDTRYDSQGRNYRTTKPYFTDSPVDDKLTVAHVDELTQTSDVNIPSQEVTTYDGAGRAVKVTTMGGADELWHTSTSYGGDRTTTVPPAGGTATTTFTDARGRTTELRQYHRTATATSTPADYDSATAADYDSTRYGYTAAGDQNVLTGPSGTVWRDEYDLHRRKTKDTDPDKGITTMTYDDAGQLLTSTDAKMTTLAYKYDALGRKIELHKDSVAGAKLAQWTYDTAVLGKGLPATSTRYVDGDPAKAYTTSVVSYNALNRPSSQTITIPASETGLAGSYNSKISYNVDGTFAGNAYAKIGDLPAETMTYSYSDLGVPIKAEGGYNGTTVKYVSDTDYTRYGELERLQYGDPHDPDHGDPGKRAWITQFYDDHTRRPTRTIVDAEVLAPMQTDTNYTYDAAGNVTSITNAPLQQTADTQCFRTDYLQRVTEAWTANQGCAADPSLSATGPAPYWQSFKYDPAGNRTKLTEHGAAGNTVHDYTYPLPTGEQPHTLSSVNTTDPAGTTNTAAFGYDKLGQTTARPAGQKLDWDAEGHLTQVTEGAKTTKFVYDADGNRLIRRDSTGSTVYLDGEELKYTAAKTLEPTRYYLFLSKTIAVRTIAGLSWLAGDQQGTAQVAITADTLAVTQRRQTPFGAPRGAAVAFPGEKGFVGGTMDAATGLTHLGAREYDPLLGRFLSVDPAVDTNDPQTLAAYTYSDNNPIAKMDPDGRWWDWIEKAAGWVDQHRSAISAGLSIAAFAIAMTNPVGWVAGAVVALNVASSALTALDAVHSIQDQNFLGFGMDLAAATLGGYGGWLKSAGKVMLGTPKAAAGALDANLGAGAATINAFSAGMAESDNIKNSREGSPVKCYNNAPNTLGLTVPCPQKPPPDPNDAKYCNGNDLAKPSCWAPVPAPAAAGPGRPGQHHGGVGSGGNYNSWMNDYTNAIGTPSPGSSHSQGNVGGNEVYHVPGKNLYYY
ncbi:RHS repeat-associated core domain-containing protein [Kribbella sp. NPDC006257]|uniref:RHS repeat-associated core domain-containing protein n=1 Tax=Kribbella sp. NPDC006257 TaxID=3156738 RepID=UPI0033A387AA